MKELNLAWMYPDCLNLHGERGSIQALVRVANNLGIDLKVLRIEDPKDTIPFEQIDLFVFLPGEIKVFPEILEALTRQKAQLTSFLDRGGYLIAIGTSGLIFGDTITREDGSEMLGLGYLDMKAVERKYVYGNDLHFRLRDSKQEIIGSQVQMADVETSMPLADTLYGWGNNNSGLEGARCKNLIYTNCLGPLFVKNPWWAEQILLDIAARKYLGLGRNAEYTLESGSFDSTLRYLAQKRTK